LEKGLDDLTALYFELAGKYHPVVADMLRISHKAFIMGNFMEGEMSVDGAQVGNIL
jgi:hypothetical protein